MNREIVGFSLALVLGWSLGSARADVPIAISRADLFEAAALCGILANSHVDPTGFAGWTMGKWVDAAHIMADAKVYRGMEKQ